MAAASKIKELGLKKVGLLGANFIMEENSYKNDCGISIKSNRLSQTKKKS
ncbi:hypothetical protein DSAG12_04000 [Promethearchaeum syntrophicum]|uniref:Uncharacterized protein n=1 Tax=Promethearchaeum syntrophicum TaxID=2594042 RepID=A0AC61ZTW8_9ARCH|nr:hypothetical protein [Candidatus Prometheoarchaeum syntrophicum]